MEKKIVRKLPGLSADALYFPVYPFEAVEHPLAPQFQNLITPGKKKSTNNRTWNYMRENIMLFLNHLASGVANAVRQRLAIIISSMICWHGILLCCHPY